MRMNALKMAFFSLQDNAVDMKFLANENFPRASFIILKNSGFDIKHIGDSYQGVKDEEVMLIAQEEGRIIITFDSDYGELVFKKGLPSNGVIYLRLGELTPELPAQIVLDITKREEIKLEGHFTVLDEGKLRQRKI